MVVNILEAGCWSRKGRRLDSERTKRQASTSKEPMRLQSNKGAVGGPAGGPAGGSAGGSVGSLVADALVSPPAAGVYLAVTLFIVDILGLKELSYFGVSSKRAWE